MYNLSMTALNYGGKINIEIRPPVISKDYWGSNGKDIITGCRNSFKTFYKEVSSGYNGTERFLCHSIFQNDC